MHKKLLFLLCLWGGTLWAQREDRLLSAVKEFKNNNYQQVLTLLEGEDLKKNLDAYFLVIQSQYAMVTQDYHKNIVKFDFNRLIQLRQSIDDYLYRSTNAKGIARVREIKEALAKYPTLELDFIIARSEKAQQQQLDSLRYSLDRRRYTKLLDLVEEYEQDKVLAPFHLEYYRLMALAKQYNKRTTPPEQKAALNEQLKAYKEAHQKKIILYDQAIEEALRKVR